MKKKKAVIFLIVIVAAVGITFSTYIISQAHNKTKAEKIIDAFMKEEGITVEKNTEEYVQLMKDILLGEYPELTGKDSKYIDSQGELDLILEYATEQMGPVFEDFPKEPDVQEVTPQLDSSDQSFGFAQDRQQ